MISEDLKQFQNDLKLQEKKEKTIKQYSKYINEFIEAEQINNKENITKEKLIEYKEQLQRVHGDKIKSINIKILIINKFLTYLGFSKDYKLKQIKVQKNYSLDNVLSYKQYEHLREYAKSHNKDMLYYLMGTLAGTGIRISELQYITYEAITGKDKQATFENKGTIRTIPLQDRVCKELKEYCKMQGITKGIIFKSRNNNPLDNAYIWRELQKLVGEVRSGIKKSSVHPHAFRHLFAIEFMSRGGTIDELADILGHKDIEITRIYTTKSTKDQRADLNKMAI